MCELSENFVNCHYKIVDVVSTSYYHNTIPKDKEGREVLADWSQKIKREKQGHDSAQPSSKGQSALRSAEAGEPNI
jgi:hypothetical protein